MAQKTYSYTVGPVYLRIGDKITIIQKVKKISYTFKTLNIWLDFRETARQQSKHPINNSEQFFVKHDNNYSNDT